MKEQEIGVITHCFNKISVAIIQLSSNLKVGDTIHVKGAHDDFTDHIASMQIEYKEVQEGKKGDLVGIKISGKAHPHDKVYKVTEE